MDDSKIIVIEDSTKDEAIKKALKKLNANKDEVKIEVLNEKKPFLGMGGSCKIRATLLSSHPDAKAEKNQEVQDRDGSYEIGAKEDGIYLRVAPPEANGKKVKLDDITSRLRFYEIKGFELNRITEAIKEPSGVQTWIAPSQEIVSKDGGAVINISKDKVEAFITLVKPWGDGNPVGKDDINELLKKEGLTYGINEELINEISSEPGKFDYDNPILIAQGETPINGEDGYIEYFFERGRGQELLFDGLEENQNINFRELNLITNATKDQQLAKIMPPTKGKPGKNVKGEEIPSKRGKEVKLLVGKNIYTKESDNCITIYAETDGRPVMMDGKIHVLPIYETKSDVDYSIGNIDFVGMVIVGGWVRDGFTIKAGGDIEIRGGVEGAELYTSGNIIIKSGIQAHDKGIIKADGDITTKYISSSRVHVKGNVIVADAIMHSEIFALGKIIAKSGRGLISGGVLRAGESVEAKTVGSHLGTETEIEVGVIPEIREELTKTEEELQKAMRNADEAQKAIALLNNEKKEKGFLIKDRKDLLNKLEETYPMLQNIVDTLEAKRDKLTASVFASKHAKLSVASKLYSGVK
ncbi:MAG TPA: DUF342 domain-containing protein, partial [Actinobacteria bacterium]|nr:DUF342 domain-containing protein [Actinomycetota bacterium]